MRQTKTRTFSSILFCGIVATGAAFVPVQSRAQSVILNADESRSFEGGNWIPYAFFSGSFGLGFGVGGSYAGWPEEPTSTVGAITLGTKGSYNLALAMSDLRVPGTQRLYVEPFFMSGKYQDQYLYVGQDNPGFEGERAGANDSDVDNYLESTQWDNRVELEFRYLLPWAHGRTTEDIVSRYVLERGQLKSGASGGTSWNPLESGRTYLTLTPGWREQTEKVEDNEVPLSTLNAEFAVERDNYDFPFNPAAGSHQVVSYKRDFDDQDYIGEWETWTVDLSKVFSLGGSDTFLQRTIALNAWSAYVPTWETDTVNGQEVVTRRPPQYEGARLGSIKHMRAYEDDRFTDKAAITYSAEYRMTPVWQPLRRHRKLEWADIAWWQWVLFAEAGQVAPHWNISDLHDDLHVDGGISLRGMLHGAVCRLDVAVGEEGTRVTAMYGHPF